MKYFLKSGTLCVNGRNIDLPLPVVELISLQDRLIARIEPKVGEIFNKNIFCIGNDGDVLWQIDESPHGGVRDKPYMSIYRTENGLVAAGNWIGVDYYVDIDDGSISCKSFNR